MILIREGQLTQSPHATPQLVCLYVLSSITISVYKRCSVRLYLQLSVGWFMSYLRYLRIVVSNTYCVVLCFCLFFFVLCDLSYGASFSSLTIFDCSFGIFSNVYLLIIISLSKLTSEKKTRFRDVSYESTDGMDYLNLRVIGKCYGV